MARPHKKSLDSFRLSVHFFSDPRIKAAASAAGIEAEIVAVRLLCAIYSNGYYLHLSDTVKTALLSELHGMTPQTFDDIVASLVRHGFFDEALFRSAAILTSHEIQQQYFLAAKRRKQTADLPYILSDDNNLLSYDANILKIEETNPRQSVESRGKVVESSRQSVENEVNPCTSVETSCKDMEVPKSAEMTDDELLTLLSAEPDPVTSPPVVLYQDEPKKRKKTEPKTEDLNIVVSQASQYLEEFTRPTAMRDAVCMRFHINFAQLETYLNTFLLDCASRGTQHANRSDAVLHFNNWLRICITEEKKQQKDDTDRQRSKNKRRGVEATDAAPQDYYRAF